MNFRSASQEEAQDTLHAGKDVHKETSTEDDGSWGRPGVAQAAPMACWVETHRTYIQAQVRAVGTLGGNQVSVKKAERADPRSSVSWRPPVNKA